MKHRYQPSTFESKWADVWQKEGIYSMPELKPGDETFYSLYSFPYPSGAGLHVGHVEGMVANDIAARYERMKGNSAVLPMGWDSFGLPAENYAIKTGIHPKDSTDSVIDTFKDQINKIGISVDWNTEVGAHWPNYYKWTQWIFLQLYTHDKDGNKTDDDSKRLAYRKEAVANWCPGCQTTLANEQVVEGNCERCDTEVIQKTLMQWFFRITAFADELHNDLDSLDWPESTKQQQRNWIGRSTGAEIVWTIRNPVTNDTFTVKTYTTRLDTLPGATFVVFAPEHSDAHRLATSAHKAKVQAYVESTAAKTERERTAHKVKSGVKTGSVAINPLTHEEVDVYLADYVLAGYGTGVVMGVPAHDQRDLEFAMAHDLPVVQVIRYRLEETKESKTGPAAIPNRALDVADVRANGYDTAMNDDIANSIKEGKAYPEYGVTSYENHPAITKIAQFNGIPSTEAKQKILRHLQKQSRAEPVTNYRLRDWLVSRQRYWGAPIPIVYDPEGTPHPVAEDDLPVELPYDVNFKPTGESPLTYTKEFHASAEERYGPGWRREVDTMDTFVDSSWYFFRHLDAQNHTEIFRKDIADAWLPTDLYMIGAEHIVLHLLYSRFFTKFFRTIGLIGFDEPFHKMRHMGTILGPDNRKMSKRWGNVINPTDVVAEYGADTVRVYEMFMGPLDAAKPWNPQNVQGAYRFLQRVHKLVSTGEGIAETDNEKTASKLQQTIAKVTSDIPEMKFNTAIAAMMEFINTWEGTKISVTEVKRFLQILAPFAPFLAEELWRTSLGIDYSVHTSTWPVPNESKILKEAVEIPVQINGKFRGTISVDDIAMTEEHMLALIKENERIAAHLSKPVKKFIYIPGKIITVVVG